MQIVLIVVELAEAGGKAEHQLEALELVEPFLSDSIQQCLLGRGEAGGAGRVGRKTREQPIFGERTVSVEAKELIVFAKEHHDGQAMAAAEAERFA